MYTVSPPPDMAAIEPCRRSMFDYSNRMITYNDMSECIHVLVLIECYQPPPPHLHQHQMLLVPVIIIIDTMSDNVFIFGNTKV